VPADRPRVTMHDVRRPTDPDRGSRG
jgi:hypothetical protein